MAESSLSLGFVELMNAVCRYLGYGPDYTDTALDDGRELTVNGIMQTGLRQFYFPPADVRSGKVHEWSFLETSATLDTTANDEDQDLGEDFGSLVGPFIYDDTSEGCRRIYTYPDSTIRHKRMYETSTGYPTMCAIRPLAATGAAGQRYEVLWYPTPDAAYTLNYKYVVLKNILSTTYPYPLGGMEHAETVKASCLAAAEIERNDEKGIYWDRYMERLQSSIAFDLRREPEQYGQNSDNSDNVRQMLPHEQSYTVTFEGS